MTQKRDKSEDDRGFTHGSSAATSDLASDPQGDIDEVRTFEGPAHRRVTPLKEGEKHDHLAKRVETAEDRQEALLDEAIEETFPGSDPISPKHIT
jgi:hypothetical protein